MGSAYGGGPFSIFTVEIRHAPPEFYQALWSKLKKGESWVGEIINRHKDGHLFTEEATITPVIDEYHRITHYIAVKQDITARKRNEEELD